VKSATPDPQRRETRDLVLSPYPLASTFRQRLGELLQRPATYLNLSQLRLKGPASALREVRSIRADRCVLAIEEPSGNALLPILQLLASISRAKALEIVTPDLRRRPVSRWDALASAAGLVGASLDGVRVARSHRLGIARLEAKARGAAHLRPTRKVLYINPNIWFGMRTGGAVAHMTGVTNAMVELGYSVDFASLTPLPISREGLRHRTLSALRDFGMPEERNYFRFQRKMLDQLVPLVERNNYEFIYQRMSVHNYVGPLLSQSAGVPLVLEYNGSEAWVAKNWGRPLRFHALAVGAETVSVRHAHLVVTVSEVLRREVIERGVEPHRVIACPNGFDPQTFAPERFDPRELGARKVSMGFSEDAIVATFVGTFGKWHGVDILARVIRRLVDHETDWLRRNNVRFLLVGDGAMLEEVRRTLGSACSEFVRLTGLLPAAEIPLILAASDILLAPHVANADGSEFFGSPTKLFEYMGMNRAIIASDVGQLGQVLTPALSVHRLPDQPPTEADAYLALLVEPGNVDELARAIRFLAMNTEWREALADSAHERALERHTWRRHVGEIVSALREVEKVP
jgi:glycosyltransferase involved in cell wall biosynthesis